MQQEPPGREGGQPPERQPSEPQPAPPPPGGQQPPPTAPPGQPVGPVGQQGMRPLLQEDSTKVWLLALFTFGIYGIIWYYRVCKELGEWSGGRIHTDPTTSVLAVTLGACVVVPPIVSWVGTLGRIREAQQMAGLPPQATFWGSVGRAFLLSYHYKWLQDQLNELSARRPA